jgi:hypothetical protein
VRFVFVDFVVYPLRLFSLVEAWPRAIRVCGLRRLPFALV